MNIAKIDRKQQENIFAKMAKALPQWLELIDRSFLTDEFKEGYKIILTERTGRVL
jgi:serine/threonine-protein kinase HipA